MTKKEKRLKLVKDCLKQLRYMNVQKGSYLNGTLCNINGKTSLKNEYIQLRNKCSVCGKGALFLIHIMKFNNVLAEDIGWSDYNNNYQIHTDNENILETLKYFSQEQLDMIECAFEREYYINDLSDTKYNLALKCVEFGWQYRTPKARLRHILENIIENDGVFKP